MLRITPTRRTARTTTLRTVTVFAAVPTERHAQLAERLREFRSGPSPFADVPGTHFARLALLGRDEFRRQVRAPGMRPAARLLDLALHGPRRQRDDPPAVTWLLFVATYDGPVGGRDDRDFFESLRLGLGERADTVWGLCEGYPGSRRPEEFVTFFVERSLPAGYVFTPSKRQPSVAAVRRALDLRRRIGDLAVDGQDLDDAALAARVRALLEPADGVEGTDAVHQPATLAVVPEPEPALTAPRRTAEVLARGSDIPTDPDLEDVQNLVTSGYPRHLAGLHLLLEVTDPVRARAWLARVADVVPTAGWAEDFVDRADYREHAAPAGSEGRGSSPRWAVHVAFSHAGLRRLGRPKVELDGFAGEFRVGMAAREPGLAPDRGIGSWRPPFATPEQPDREVHVLAMLSANDREALEGVLDDRPWLRPGPAQGLRVLDAVRADRIEQPDAPRVERPGGGSTKPGFVEHFGFVDGLSQPSVHGVTAGRRAAELPAGEALLGYLDVDGDISGAGLPTALARNGSYLVWRRLQQDVTAFTELTRELGERLRERVAEGTDPAELAAAKLMGRWRDGTPTTLARTAPDPSADRYSFGFGEHDADGAGCPVGAHVRRVNPRDTGPVDPETGGLAKLGVGRGPVARHEEAEVERTLTQRHRMLRRGMPYGPALRPAERDDRDGDGEPDVERGLLFVAVVGDIRRQFEFVQAHWMADGNAFRLGSDRDPMSGAGGTGKFVVQGEPPVFVRPPRPLVTCRGGEYFFMPGIAALRRIATG